MKKPIEHKCVCGHTIGWHGKSKICFANNGRCKCSGFVKTNTKPVNNDTFICAKCQRLGYVRLSRGYSFCLLCNSCYNKDRYHDFVKKISKRRPEVKKKFNSILKF
jgi:hypothetical protein